MEKKRIDLFLLWKSHAFRQFRHYFTSELLTCVHESQNNWIWEQLETPTFCTIASSGSGGGGGNMTAENTSRNVIKPIKHFDRTFVNVSHTVKRFERSLLNFKFTANLSQFLGFGHVLRLPPPLVDFIGVLPYFHSASIYVTSNYH